MPTTRAVLVAACLAVCLAACAPGTDAPTSSAPQVIRVIATDYAFEAPDTVAAGLVTWQVENNGEEGHHLIVYRIDGGQTVDDALAQVAIDQAWPDWLVSMGGPEGTEDPDLGGGFTMRLEPGQYLLVCAIGHPEGNTHAAHGMVHPFVVTGQPGDQADPVATDTIRMIDFAFAIPDTISAGDVRFLVLNEGMQRHHMVMEQVPDTAGMAQVLADLTSAEIPPGYRSVGGFTSMAPGGRGWYEVNLVPGRYLTGCLITDPATGRPHHELGMVRLIEVVSRTS